MHIPEKYRDRYDRLAASHPWMREMRDEPTNGIDGETNGIADEIPLPDGDAVRLMREHSLYEIGVILHPAGGGGCILSELADMVERDYVSREKWTEAIRAMKAAQDAMERARDERDEWKSKAEVKDAKRAAAVERLKDARYHTLADYIRAMLGWGHEPHFEDCRDALIDLLTDNDAHSTTGNMTEQPKSLSGLYGILGDEKLPETPVFAENPQKSPEKGRENDQVDSREKLEADIKRYLSQAGSHGMVCGWLNRQAAITERELQAKVDELTAELAIREKMCDELQGQVDRLTKRLACSELRACSDFAQKCEVCDRTTLLEEIEGLTKERDGLRDKINQIRSIITDETPND